MTDPLSLYLDEQGNTVAPSGAEPPQALGRGIRADGEIAALREQLNRMEAERERERQQQQQQVLMQQQQQQQQKQQQEQQRPPDIDVRKYISPDNLARFGEGGIGALQEVASNLAQEIRREVKQGLTQQQQELLSLKQATEQSQQQQFVDRLTNQCPNWSEIQRDPRFRTYLSETISTPQGVIARESALKTAYDTGNADYVAHMYKEFESLSRGGQQAAPAPTATREINTLGVNQAQGTRGKDSAEWDLCVAAADAILRREAADSRLAYGQNPEHTKERQLFERKSGYTPEKVISLARGLTTDW